MKGRGFFSTKRERERVISLCDMMMRILDNFSSTLMACLICVYLFINLSLLSYSFVKYHSTLTDSEYHSWCILAGSSPAPSPLPPPPPPPSPRLLLRCKGAPDVLTMYVYLHGRFLGCLLFSPFTEILHLWVKAPNCLTTVPLTKLFIHLF